MICRPTNVAFKVRAIRVTRIISVPFITWLSSYRMADTEYGWWLIQNIIHQSDRAIAGLIYHLITLPAIMIRQQESIPVVSGSKQKPKYYGFFSTGQYLGCFIDAVGNRTLPHGVYENEKYNEPKKCIAECSSRGFAFAGLQFSLQCWCGGDGYDKHGAADGQCNMPCPGDGNFKCGDSYRNSVYRVGERQVIPWISRAYGRKWLIVLRQHVVKLRHAQLKLISVQFDELALE